MATHLFLASTPFNMLTAAMVAFELPDDDEAMLGLIDQPEAERPFVAQLQLWAESPFKTIQRVSSQAKGRQKRAIRQSAFQNIDALLAQYSFDHIYTGNDRRIEFQYAMYKSGCSHGVYIDDGTYSYLGRETHWFKDKIIDNWAKKFSYGGWWQQPPTIGGSAWIQQAVLAFPDAAVDALKMKRIVELPKNLDRPEFSSLAKACIRQSRMDEAQLGSLDALLLLPHESVSDPAMRHQLAYWLSNRNGRIAFKHHPRTLKHQPDDDQRLWGLPEHAVEVPADIPMEVLLPLLAPSCSIAGDVSTALLTSKWLRSELAVTAFCTEHTGKAWINLLHRLNIQTVQATDRTTV